MRLWSLSSSCTTTHREGGAVKLRLWGGLGDGAQINARWDREVRINEQNQHWIVRNWRSSLVALATTHFRSLGERRSSSESVAGATEDASPGEQWPSEILGDSNSLVRDWGKCGLNIYYARPDWGGAAYSGRGGDEKGTWRKW